MAKYVSRVTKVMRVFSKHGLAGLLVKLGFAHYLSIFSRYSKADYTALPEKLSNAIAELGGGWIKLGQFLSLRPDLIPKEYADEFSKLLDQVPPIPTEEIKQVITNEFKKPVEQIFKHFDPRPLGSASVAQVHKARLKDGKPVAVKVLKPNVKEQFSSDLAIMRIIANQLDTRLESSVKPSVIVDEFERYTKQELNLTAEASHIDTIRANTKMRTVVIPKVYWDYTTKNVLTMDYLDGIKIENAQKTQKQGIANKIVDAMIDQVYVHGVFHADLHPGNILLLKNNKIGLLDFGILGHLDEQTRKLSMKLYSAIIERDEKKVVELLLEYGEASPSTNKNDFASSITDLIRSWWESKPEERRVTHLLHLIFILSAKYVIIFPKDCILLGKALMTAEATARKLDPEFDFVKSTRPKVMELMKERKLSRKTIQNFATQSLEFAEALSKLPQKTLQTVENIRKGELSISLRDENFRHIGKDLNLSSNRLSYALVASALIIAASYTVDIKPFIAGYSVFSLLSLIIALMFVIALLVSISREHKKSFDKHNN